MTHWVLSHFLYPEYILQALQSQLRHLTEFTLPQRSCSDITCVRVIFETQRQIKSVRNSLKLKFGLGGGGVGSKKGDFMRGFGQASQGLFRKCSEAFSVEVDAQSAF